MLVNMPRRQKKAVRAILPIYSYFCDICISILFLSVDPNISKDENQISLTCQCMKIFQLFMLPRHALQPNSNFKPLFFVNPKLYTFVCIFKLNYIFINDDKILFYAYNAHAGCHKYFMRKILISTRNQILDLQLSRQEHKPLPLSRFKYQNSLIS